MGRDVLTNGMIMLGKSIPDYQAKAVANYMFREIIEDAHAKYNISQEDMKSMCKQAVNRASLMLEFLAEPDLADTFFSIEACAGKEWDNPEVTDEIQKMWIQINEAAGRTAE